MYDPYQGYSPPPPQQYNHAANNYPPPPGAYHQPPSVAGPTTGPGPRGFNAGLPPPPPPGFIPPPAGLPPPSMMHPPAQQQQFQAYGPPLHISPVPPPSSYKPALASGPPTSSYGDFNRPRGDPAREHLPLGAGGVGGPVGRGRERDRDDGWNRAPLPGQHQRRRSASPPVRGSAAQDSRPPPPRRGGDDYYHQPPPSHHAGGPGTDYNESYGNHQGRGGGSAGRGGGRGGARGGGMAGRDSEHDRSGPRRGGGAMGSGPIRGAGRAGQQDAHAAVNPDMPNDEHARIVQERKNRERPCRTLFVRNVKFGVTSDDIRTRFEAFGDVKTFFDMLERRGMAFITYFDIRAAMLAKDKLNEVRIANRPIDVHYSLPRDLDITQRCDRDKNQGTLSVAVVDARGPLNDQEIYARFGAFGQIKAVTPRPDWPGARLVEFFDSRAAERALDELNGAPMAGGRIDADFDWDPLPLPTPEPDRGSHSGYVSQSGPGPGGPPGNGPGSGYGGPPRSYGGPPPPENRPTVGQGQDYGSRPGPGPGPGPGPSATPLPVDNQLEQARKVQALLAQLGGGAPAQSPPPVTPTLGSASQGPTGPPQGGNPSLPPAIAALLASNRGVAGGLQAQPASQSPQQQQQQQQQQSQYMGYEPGRSAQSSPSMPSQSNYQPQQQSQQQHSSASSQSGNAAAPAQVQALLDMLARQNTAHGR